MAKRKAAIPNLASNLPNWSVFSFLRTVKLACRKCYDTTDIKHDFTSSNTRTNNFKKNPSLTFFFQWNKMTANHQLHNCSLSNKMTRTRKRFHNSMPKEWKYKEKLHKINKYLRNNVSKEFQTEIKGFALNPNSRETK